MRTALLRTESRRTMSLLTGLPEAPRRVAGLPETGLSETGFRPAAPALMSFFRNRSQPERSPGANPKDGAAPAKSLFQKRTAASVFFSDEGADFEEKTEEYSELPLKDDGEEEDLEETVGRAEYDKLFDNLEDSGDDDEEEDYDNEEGEED